MAIRARLLKLQIYFRYESWTQAHRPDVLDWRFVDGVALAGKNLLLKPNQILFKTGEKSNGMFIVRRGKLKVFLQESKSEVTLAEVGPGSMIGEMALFDHKPRSASVKATEPSEVTLISNEDFQRLLKQIPKWFNGLMVTLSTRLRTTNERLQKLEHATGGGAYIYRLPTVLGIMSYIISNEGTKKEAVKGDKKIKETVVSATKIKDVLVNEFGEKAENITAILDALTDGELFEKKKDGNNIGVIKGDYNKFLVFLKEYLANQNPALSQETIEMLGIAAEMGERATYDLFTVTFTELQEYGMQKGINTALWGASIGELVDLHTEVQVVKGSDGKPGIRGAPKDLVEFHKHHRILYVLAQVQP